MMGRWNLPTESAEGASPFEVDQVLVHYDGPQIVTLRDEEDNRYLGVASDEGEGLVRWIYAPLTNTEFKALMDGVATTRDALLKSCVYLVDIDVDGNAVRRWECDAADISDENLPDVGALLPEETRRTFSVQPANAPELILENVGVERKGILFRSLSEILNAFQRFWNAMAQAVSPEGPKERGRWSADSSESAGLALSGAGQGSLILHINPTDARMFEKAAGAFEELARASDEPQVLAGVIERLGTRVQARYEELLTNLERHKLQLLARRPGGAAFLAPHVIPRVLSALPKAVAGEPKTVPATGYFLSFDVGNGNFELYDEGKDFLFKGKVHPEVLKRHDAITVGAGVTYAVFIEVTTLASASRRVMEEAFTLRVIGPRSSAS